MRKVRLGGGDLEVTPIGLGTWQFSQGKGLVGSFWKSLDTETTRAVVKAALDGGIDWFDTAEAYGKGASERSLAGALSALGVAPGSVRIATKWWPFMRTAASIPATIAERQACLDPYPIDLYQIHQPYGLSSKDRQVAAMGELVVASQVRAVGVSNFSAAQMEAAHALLANRGLRLVSNQVRISLLDRSVERNGVLEAARRLGVTLIAYSPLAQGLLTGRYHDDPSAIAKATRARRLMGSLRPSYLARTAPLVAELKRVAAAHGATPSQVALNWLVTRWGDAVVAIPGASRPSQAAEAAGALGLALEAQEVQTLDDISLSV
jgi:aryl-alcohol dehydrogenase-like predicted oxidoreductase